MNYIWWLSESAQKELEPLMKPESFSMIPAWLRVLLRDIQGRSCHGRIWMDSRETGEVSISDAVFDSGIMSSPARSCSGIVIPTELLPRILGYPGFVTQTDLNPIRLRSVHVDLSPVSFPEPEITLPLPWPILTDSELESQAVNIKQTQGVIPALKLIRLHRNLSLKEAKELLESFLSKGSS